MPKHSPTIGSCKSYHGTTNGTCNDRGVSFSPLRQIHSKRAEVFIKTLSILVYQIVVIHALKVCHNRKKKTGNGREENSRLHRTLLGLRAPTNQESIYTGPLMGKTGFALRGVSHHDQSDLIPPRCLQPRTQSSRARLRSKVHLFP